MGPNFIVSASVLNITLPVEFLCSSSCESTDLLCVSEGELFGDTAGSNPFFISDGFSESVGVLWEGKRVHVSANQSVH